MTLVSESLLDTSICTFSESSGDVDGPALVPGVSAIMIQDSVSKNIYTVFVLIDAH